MVKKNIIYFGEKTYFSTCVIRVGIGNYNTFTNRPLTHIVRHSPDGFNFGYSGSGPADLSLSILTDYCEKTEKNIKIAENNYQLFKEDFISCAKNKLRITGTEIEKWLKEKIND